MSNKPEERQEAALAELDQYRETTAGRDDLIVRAYKARIPARKIGLRDGIGRRTIYRVLEQQGIPLRSETQFVTVTAAESNGTRLPDRIAHGHHKIGAVHTCAEDAACKPRSQVVMEFDPQTRKILGVR
ncbi:hypothetical protein ACGFJT_37185 [Actinomadura geliboluensis]|uniref:hypothetical protein n=1 Tax=Actinomadura geliboluensis TaxID=882440 RepID=UPI0037202E5B